jgi:hypothetical protein
MFGLDFWQLLYMSGAVIGAWGLGALLKISGSAERIFVGLKVSFAYALKITVIDLFHWLINL